MELQVINEQLPDQSNASLATSSEMLTYIIRFLDWQLMQKDSRRDLGHHSACNEPMTDSTYADLISSGLRQGRQRQIA